MNGNIGCPTDIGSILDRSYFLTEKHEQKEHKLNRLQCDSFIKLPLILTRSLMVAMGI